MGRVILMTLLAVAVGCGGGGGAKTGGAGTGGGAGTTGAAGTGGPDGGAGTTGAAGTGGPDGSAGTTGAAGTGAPVTKTIGPAGGNVQGADGKVAVVIPAGALAADTMITIGPAASTVVPAGVKATSSVYAFGPDGTTFAKPVTVGFLVPGADAGSKIYWSKAGASGFDELTPTPMAGGFLTAEVTHFSMGFVGGPVGAGGCSAADTATDAFLKAYPPVSSPRGTVVGALEASAAGVWAGAFLSPDGVHFEPLSPGSSTGSTFVVDAARDWVYSFATTGSSFRRRHITGCWEDAGMVANVRSAYPLAVGPGGEVLARGDLADNTSVAVVGSGGTWTTKGVVPRYADMTGAFAPSDAKRMWLTGSFSGSLVIRSTDGGATWSTPVKLNINNTAKVYSIVADPTDATLVYASSSYGGIYKSTDGGATFAVDPAQPAGGSPGLRMGTDRRLWAYNDMGLFVRAAGAATWTAVNGDLPDEDLPAGSFAQVEGASPVLWRASGQHLWKSTDAGAHWTHNASGLPGMATLRSSTHPSDDKKFVAYYGNPGNDLASMPATISSIWITSDGGATFKEIANPVEPSSPLALRYIGDSLFTLGALGGATGLGLLSTDGGMTFNPVTGIALDAVAGIFSPDKDPKIAYLSGRDLYRTLDGGATWAKIGDLTIPAAQGNGPGLLVDASTSKRVYVVQNWNTARRLQRSLDGGDTWTDLTLDGTAAAVFNYGNTVIDLQGRIWMTGTPDRVAQKLYILEPGTTAFVEKPLPAGATQTMLFVNGATVRLGDLATTDGGTTWTKADPTKISPDTLGSEVVYHRANPKRALFNFGSLRNGVIP